MNLNGCSESEEDSLSCCDSVCYFYGIKLV